MTDLPQLAAALASLARLLPDGARLDAVGWATVDLERTIAALTGGDATGVDGIGPEVEEPALGARARVVERGAVSLVVLEPSTEGRLAAALARRGEGIACLYVSGAPPGAIGGARRTAVGRNGRILPHDRPWGPFIILLEGRPDR